MGGAIVADDTPFTRADAEFPIHNETVTAFGLGKFEVSNARFEKFVDATSFITESEKFGWSFGVEAMLSEEVSKSITQMVASAPWWLPVEHADWRRPHGVDSNITDVMDHPVVHVSKADAEAFCSWSRPGGRLPTEQEWEYAARGKRKRKRFPWGNDMLTGKNKNKHRMNIWQSTMDEALTANGVPQNIYTLVEPRKAVEMIQRYYTQYDNMKLDGCRGSCPVDAFGPQNEQGFHNMVGNVWEWTSTPWLRSDPRMPEPEPNSFVKKGGSFLCNVRVCNRYRNSARMVFTADSAASNVGFRCAYPGKPTAAAAAAADDAAAADGGAATS
eukprot:NODE_1657_length_1091_cov_316.439189.p1 GENE.NODE_1657_length_1091_cov_316.439189~~NODE_1657_length_1091_cov_316.439189.p1  ORF type:complete len:329 (+),score=92.03 NODE_1657_length_1091_cov_316.439189:3-989(+)